MVINLSNTKLHPAKSYIEQNLFVLQMNALLNLVLYEIAEQIRCKAPRAYTHTLRHAVLQKARLIHKQQKLFVEVKILQSSI